MKQSLRFNKVIRFTIITGDICLLNALFVGWCYMMDIQTLGIPFASSILQLLVLSNLLYIICNYPRDIVLHQRIVLPERIIAFRNTSLHSKKLIPNN